MTCLVGLILFRCGLIFDYTKPVTFLTNTNDMIISKSVIDYSVDRYYMIFRIF